MIGISGLIEKEVEARKEIEVTYSLAHDVWGDSYATEIVGALRDCAALKLRVARRIALIYSGNVASARVAVKIEMCFEREIVRPGSAFRQSYVWAAHL